MNDKPTTQDRIAWLRRQVDYWQRLASGSTYTSYAAEELKRHQTLLRKAEVELAADERQGKLFDVS